MDQHEHAKDPHYGWVVLSVTTLGALLSSIQASALLIALPDIMGSLGADFLTVMWILLSYLLVTTAILPVVGRLADMFGRKRLYILGFAVFTLGSLLCGFAQPQFHGWDLVAYRLVQGVGGALLMANSAAMVTDAFDARRLGLGLGINQIAIAAGMVLGPVVGGILTPISWQWIFWFNVPFGVIGTIWGIIRLKEPQIVKKAQRFDVWGGVTFLVGLTALLLAASLVSFPLLDAFYVYLFTVIGLVSIAAFLYIEPRVKHPMIDFSLFRQRNFALANLTNLLNGMARGAVLFLLIFFLQGPYGKDPFTAGLMLIPFGLVFMAVGPVSGYLSDRYSSRNLQVAGLLVVAVALLGFAQLSPDTPFWQLAVLMALMGAGSGLFNSPNTRSIMYSVAPDRRGVAAGTRVMLANVGTMVSLAIAFPLVLSGIPMNDLLNLFLYGGGISQSSLDLFMSGLHESFLLFFAISLLAALAAAMCRPAQEGR